MGQFVPKPIKTSGVQTRFSFAAMHIACYSPAAEKDDHLLA